MYSCDQCSGLLLDYVYGLLDEGEAQALRDHLASCPACRSALTEAEAQQNLIARAAQVYAEVPPFTAPAAETPESTEVPAPAAAAPAAPAAVQTPPATLPELIQARSASEGEALPLAGASGLYPA